METTLGSDSIGAALLYAGLMVITLATLYLLPCLSYRRAVPITCIVWLLPLHALYWYNMYIWIYLKWFIN